MSSSLWSHWLHCLAGKNYFSQNFNFSTKLGHESLTHEHHAFCNRRAGERRWNRRGWSRSRPFSSSSPWNLDYHFSSRKSSISKLFPMQRHSAVRRTNIWQMHKLWKSSDKLTVHMRSSPDTKKTSFWEPRGEFLDSMRLLKSELIKFICKNMKF